MPPQDRGSVGYSSFHSGQRSGRAMASANRSSLEGQVAIVTGAAGGVGKATVELLVELGASVIAEDIDPAVSNLAGEHVIAVAGDVRAKPIAEEAVRRALERFGSVDILV